jgi:hypothetical protein
MPAVRTRPLAMAIFALLALAARAPAEGPASLGVTSLGAPPETLPARAAAWLPLEVAIDSGGAPLDAVLRCRRTGAHARAPVLFERRVTLGAQRRMEQIAFFLPEGRGEAEIELLREGAPGEPPLARASFAWKEAEESLVIAVSRDGSAERIAAHAELGRIARAAARTVALRPEELPQSPEALSLARAIVVANADLRALSPAQGAALRGYVEAGGQLILVFSGNAAEYRQTEVASLLPCEVAGAATRAVPALEPFEDPLAEEPPGPLLAAIVRPLAGASVLLADEGGPLAVRRRVGAGTVTYLALDPSRRRAGALPSRLFAWLVAAEDPPPPVIYEDRPADPAFDELARRASGGETVRPPSFLFVGAILLAYIALAVPVNFAFWRRRGRLERTAPTAALLALGFGGALYVFGVSMKGHAGLATEAALFETAAGEPAGRALAACGVFAPERRLARIEARLPAAPAGEGGAAVVRLDGSAAGPARVLESVELDQWALRLFRLEGPAAVPAIRADLRLAEDEVSGALAAPEDAALAGAVLLLGRRALVIGELPAGAERAIRGRLDPEPASWGSAAGEDSGAGVALRAALTAEIRARPRGPAGDGELEALLLARLEPRPAAAPWLALDFAAPLRRSVRFLAATVPLKIAPGRLDLGPGIVRPRLVAASPDALTRGARGRYELAQGTASFEWILPARAGFHAEAIEIDLGSDEAALRAKVGTLEVGLRGGKALVKRGAEGCFDPRTGAIRLTLTNPDTAMASFAEPTLAVRGRMAE